MIFEIEITFQAKAELRGIYEYIAYDLRSPKNAKGQLERLELEILNLNQMPERFPKLNIEPWYSRGLRVMPVDNYRVLYTVDK
ncbi:type II toxin-antitoxin system RelE/ParE family toxin [Aerococcaceae bacterium DSM 111022]|nr:type II toxin-antitoxin system RelE/ParE family toxin [Aerococcaceae bacterium DSM 111022]